MQAIKNRYHVIEKDSGVLCTERTFEAASKSALSYAERDERWTPEVSIYDLMARDGAVNLWRVSDGKVIEESKKQ